MAASTVIFNISRSPLPHYSPPSSSLTPTIKTSRVNFTSKGGNATGKSIEFSIASRVYAGKEWSVRAKPTTEEEEVGDDKPLFEKLAGAATEYAEETMENVKAASGGITGIAEEYADEAKEKTKEAVNTIEAKAEEKTDEVAEPEKTDEVAEPETTTEESSETSEKVKETTTEEA